MNLQPRPEPVTMNSHSSDTVVLRNVILAACTSLVTKGDRGRGGVVMGGGSHVLYGECPTNSDW